jgi:hypothetical protein
MNRLHFLAACISATLTFHISHSQEVKRIPPEKPRIIVGIVVSQMRYDYIERFWDKLDENGIRLLVNRGTSCKNTSFNYLFSQQGVGHASIATGTTPADHGIVGREWYLYLQDKIEQSTEDQLHKAVGGDVDNGRYSPKNLMCTTFSDELRLSNNFSSKVFSISFDPAPEFFLQDILQTGFTGSTSAPETGSQAYYADSFPVD